MKQSEFKAFSEVMSDVADYYGKPLKPATIRIYWAALEPYDLPLVKRLLSEHVQSSKFMPAVSEILDRIKAADGRPGPEEAWAAIPHDERGSVVWTDEMAEAFGVANPLIQQGDPIAARMAFLERYRALVNDARKAGKAIRWTPSLGHDPADRERALIAAQRRGLLSQAHVAGLLPYRDAPAPEIAALLPDLRPDRPKRSLTEALEKIRADRESEPA